MTDQDRILRHRNGGALKIGLGVHVSADSFCDAESVLTSGAHVFGSSLSQSRIGKHSHVFNSTLESVIGIGSVFADSACRWLLAEDAVLHRVKAEASISGHICLKDVVAENCELYGNWTLEGIARIPTGKWYRPPRFKLITGDNGVSVGLTESTDGHALMACWRKPLTSWIKAGPRLGRLHHWLPAQVVEAKDFFTMLADVPLDGVSK